jgi:ribonuclease HI
MKHKWRRSNRTTYKLEVTWIKGHVHVKGNERVDVEVKKVVKGNSSKAHNLPEYLK